MGRNAATPSHDANSLADCSSDEPAVRPLSDQSLVRAGINDVALSLNYQADKIESILGNGSELGARLRFVTDPSLLGTTGARRFPAGDICDAIVVMNGDVLTYIKNITEMIRFHRQRRT